MKVFKNSTSLDVGSNQELEKRVVEMFQFAFSLLEKMEDMNTFHNINQADHHVVRESSHDKTSAAYSSTKTKIRSGFSRCNGKYLAVCR